MADSFVEGSFQIDLLNDEEVTWWKNQELVEVHEDNEDEHSSDWQFDDATLALQSIWFHGDPNLNIEAAVNTCQRFLKECRPDGSIGFSWSETCSKPRLDSFGGGSVFVTAHNTEWNGGYDWLQKKQTEFSQKGPFPVIDLSFQGWCRGVEVRQVLDLSHFTMVETSGVTSEELKSGIESGLWALVLGDCLGQNTNEEIEISDVEASR